MVVNLGFVPFCVSHGQYTTHANSPPQVKWYLHTVWVQKSRKETAYAAHAWHQHSLYLSNSWQKKVNMNFIKILFVPLLLQVNVKKTCRNFHLSRFQLQLSSYRPYCLCCSSFSSIMLNMMIRRLLRTKSLISTPVSNTQWEAIIFTPVSNTLKTSISLIWHNTTTNVSWR